jgi:hypothetical protein
MGERIFMRYCLLAVLLTAAAIVIAGCGTAREPLEVAVSQESQAPDEPQVGPSANADEEPPLLLDDEPLLLLDDGPDESAAPEEGADNSRCFVCHMNYVREELAVTHARAFIGCASCHGECDAHIDDESWASGGNGTAPDIMYRLEEVNPFCLGCHSKETIDTEQHKAVFAGTGEKKYCTDCHGDHRLDYRRCKWK